MDEFQKRLNHLFVLNDQEQIGCAVDWFLSNTVHCNLMIESGNLDQLSEFYDLLMPSNYLSYYANHISSNQMVPLVDLMIQLYTVLLVERNYLFRKKGIPKI